MNQRFIMGGMPDNDYADAQRERSAKAKQTTTDTERIEEAAMNRGTIAALAVVYSMGHEVCWGEIIRAAGVQSVLQHALTEKGDWEWAGFDRLAINELGEEAVAAACATLTRATAEPTKGEQQ